MNSDTLYLITSEKQLTKFEDFSILVRNGWPYLTLKINNNISIGAILQDQYNLQYPVSQANEILYQDAKEVAKENSRPRFNYDVQVSQIPGNIEHFELGPIRLYQ